MTRRRDMMMEDVFGCQHQPETPVSDESGAILYWVCRCGRKHPVPEPKEKADVSSKKDDSK